MPRIDGIKPDSPLIYDHANNRWKMIRPDNGWTTRIYPGTHLEDYFITQYVNTGLGICVGSETWQTVISGANSNVLNLNEHGGGLSLRGGDANGRYAEISLGAGSVYPLDTSDNIVLQFKGHMDEITDVKGEVGMKDSTGNFFVKVLFDSSSDKDAILQCQNGVGNITEVDTGIEVEAEADWDMYFTIEDDSVELHAIINGVSTLVGSVSSNIPTNTKLNMYIRCTSLGAATKELHVHKFGAAVGEI